MQREDREAIPWPIRTLHNSTTSNVDTCATPSIPFLTDRFQFLFFKISLSAIGLLYRISEYDIPDTQSLVLTPISTVYTLGLDTS